MPSICELPQGTKRPAGTEFYEMGLTSFTFGGVRSIRQQLNTRSGLGGQEPYSYKPSL